MTLTFRSTDLNANGLDLHLTMGYSEHASVRGTDVVIPNIAGRYVRNRIADVRTLRLEGHVSALTPEEWRIATDTLMALCDPTLDPGELVMTSPYLGLASGVTATINARVVNVVGGPIIAGKLFQRWSIELESVDPDWVLT